MSEANLCMTYVRGWRVVVEIIDLFLYVSQMINHRDRKLNTFSPLSYGSVSL